MPLPRTKKPAAAPGGAAKTTGRYAKSQQAFERACALMPGGVSSPVRAFKSVGRDPITIREAEGCRVTDVDGNVYIDYVLSYGPAILGHARESVVVAINKAAQRGTSFGMTSEGELALAELIIAAMPSVELVRFVNSGTEATMSAIRLARGATGRVKIVKATGCYHGHSDALLVEAGSGALTHGVPSSPGVPPHTTADTVVVPFNDGEAVERALQKNKGEIAAILIEPIAGNMGTIPPRPGYLQSLRTLCDQHGAILIFDEVMTGFRVAWGGAQALYGVTPDLTCLGKVMGGGLPCAAYGGRESLMRKMSPDGPIYQAGTLSGNPVAMAAGLATLDALKDGAAYKKLEQSSAALAKGLKTAADRTGVPLCVQRVGSMLTPFFVGHPVENFEQAVNSDTKSFTVFFNAMLDRGVVLPPSQYETWFVSTEHNPAAIDQTIKAAEESFEIVAKSKRSK